MIMLFRAEGVSFTEFAYVMSTNSFISNIAYFGRLINGILVGILIVGISLSLVRNKISANKMTSVGIVIISITALITAILTIMSIVFVILTPSFQTLLNMDAQISKITYPVFPIFFLGSILLFTAGYIKEKLKTSSIKDWRIVLPSLALLVIILIDFIRIFR